MNAVVNKIESILKSIYDTKNYVDLVNELFPNVHFVAPDKYRKEFSNFSSHIAGSIHVGNYKTPDSKDIIIMAVQLNNAHYVENSRSTQRSYAKKLIENANADAAFIAFYTEGEPKWRLSFVRLDYEMKIDNGRLKTMENMTPAKRYSYLVGQDEPCNTVTSRFERFITDSIANQEHPTLDDLEEAFSVEKVTNEFFELYCEKFQRLREQLEVNENFRIESEQHNFTSAQFAKKLMGQIVFLYFLQKKGWLGVSAWPNTLTEKEYKNAFYARGSKSRELIPKVYRPVGDGTYRVSGNGLNSISDVDEEVLAQCVKGQPWGTGPHNFMRKLFELAEKRNINFFDELLEPLFYEALNVNRGENGYCPALHCRIPFLSGGLFEPIDGYDWKHNDFAIPNEVFSNISSKGRRDADGILDIFDRYNFTMSEDEPMEREVAIDPEMLGKVFENLLEVKDRKSKGAFYTPREIVHYMCQESLINYLTNALQIEEEAIREFILYGDFMKDKDTVKEKRQGNRGMYISERLYKLDKEGNVVVNRLMEMDKALQDVRVADPAVGSGAFPLGMLNEIIRARQNISAYLAITMNSYDKRMMYQIERSPHTLKYETIRNCIFAADIEPSAVDIAQLRLWLSLVIDDEINPNAQNPLDGHRNPLPLPNLESNILCGNSLIDEFEGIRLINESDLLGNAGQIHQTKLYQSRYESILVKLIQKQEELFRCDNTEKKKQLKEEITSLRDMIILSQLEGCDEAKQNYYQSKNAASRPYVLWHLDFARVFREKGGFDIVIGNPPYIKIQNIDTEQAETLKRKYETATGKFDVYVLFIEKSMALLKDNGITCFIQPHRFLNAGYGKGLRNYLKSTQGLSKFIHFGVNQVFNSATTYTGVFYYQKNSPFVQYAQAVEKNLNGLTFLKKQWSDLDDKWSFSFKGEDGILEKINSAGIKFLEIFEGVYQGIITLGDNKFIFDGHIEGDLFYGYSKEIESKIVLEADIVKPLLKGENIRRYAQPTSTMYVFYPHVINAKGKTEPISEEILMADYPLAYAYISKFRDELEAKKNKYKTNPKYWYSLHRAREKQMLDSNKIITPQLQNYCNFAIDNCSMYPDAGGYMLIIKPAYLPQLMYYYGILNSSLFYHFIKSTSTAFNNNYYYFKTAYIQPFCFPKDVTNSTKIEITKLVQTILDIRSKNAASDVSEYERKIDSVVYQLYGITESELNQIEEKYNIQ